MEAIQTSNRQYIQKNQGCMIKLDNLSLSKLTMTLINRMIAYSLPTTLPSQIKINDYRQMVYLPRRISII